MRAFPRFLFPVLMTAVVFAGESRPAHAQAKRDPAAAEVLFNQGRTLLDAKRYNEACAKFEESQRLDPGAGTVMNLANCEEQRGRFATAWAYWREAADSLAPSDDRMAYVKDRVTAAGRRVARLTLVAPANWPSNATVERDGTPVGVSILGTPIPTDPGKHQIRVRAPGRAEWSTTIDLAERANQSLTLGLGLPLPSATGPAPVPPSPPPVANDPLTKYSAEPEGPKMSTRKKVGYVLGGVGAASMVTGIITGIVGANKQGEADDACPDGECPTREAVLEAQEASDDAKPYGVAFPVLLGIGAAALGGGIYLIVTDEPESTSVAFVPAPGGGTLTYAKSFF